MMRLTAAAMSASLTPITVMLWLSWPTDAAIAPRFRPKPCTKPRPIFAFLPCRATTATLIASCARSAGTSPSSRRHVEIEPLGDDPSRSDPDDRHAVPPDRHAEIVGRDRRALDAVEPDRIERRARCEERILDQAPAGDHRLDAAFRETFDKHEIGAPARRDKAAVAQPEGVRARPARGAIDGVERPAELDQRADHEIEVALLADVERVPIVGAKRHERGGVLVEHLGERVEVLRHRPFADQDRHPLGELLARLRRRRRFVVGADAGGEIGVQVAAREKRRVPVDVAVLEGGELVEGSRVEREDTRESS